jgi:hypothetical protein
MPAPAAVLPAPVPGGKLAGLPDFSERLSPMLVKELRQGMRSPLFVWGLISMNLFLAGVVWLTMGDPGENSLHQAFFGGYCALVCGLLPLRAAGALHDELRGNTIDTLILTRLTGWRITLGKWVAVAAQQLLATITVLPYLIVRYFAGGVDVPMELAWLGIFLLTGMGSAAILTGFSWIRYFLFRAAIMMGLTFATGAFCVAVLEQMFGYRRQYLLDEIFRTGGWRVFLLVLLPAAHAVFFALDVGASKVGSMVENRPVRRRVVGAMVIFAYGLLAWFCQAYEWWVLIWTGVLASATLLIIGLQALLEHPVNLPAVVMPMVRRGWWGRLAGRFLYPGWPSGVNFVFFLLLAAGLVFSWRFHGQLPARYGGSGPSQPDSGDWAFAVAGWGALAGMLPVPLVLWQVGFRKRLPWHLGIYVLLLFTVAALEVALIVMAASLENHNLLKWGWPVPTMGWAWLDRVDYRFFNENWDSGNLGWTSPLMEVDPARHMNWTYETITVTSGLVSLAWWGLALLIASRAFRATRAVEREAAAWWRGDPP